jgi:hypothetical protein
VPCAPPVRALQGEVIRDVEVLIRSRELLLSGSAHQRAPFTTLV